MYLQFYTPLLEFAFRYTRDVARAEEVVHDVFLALWSGRETWAPSHGIKAYLFGAVRNRALNVGRAAGSAARVAPEIGRAVTPPGLADEAVLTRERATAVHRAVAALPERTREAVTLRWLHGMSHAAVASVFGVSEDAARKLVARAAGQLRELLRDYADG